METDPERQGSHSSQGGWRAAETAQRSTWERLSGLLPPLPSREPQILKSTRLFSSKAVATREPPSWNHSLHRVPSVFYETCPGADLIREAPRSGELSEVACLSLEPFPLSLEVCGEHTYQERCFCLGCRTSSDGPCAMIIRNKSSARSTEILNFNRRLIGIFPGCTLWLRKEGKL